MIDTMMLDLYDEVISQRKIILKRGFKAAFGVFFVYYTAFILFFVATDNFPIFGHSSSDKEFFFCYLSDFLLLVVIILQMVTTFYGIYMLSK